MSTILTGSYEPGFPSDWEGLDIASAEDATPKWYGVSYGNGNDGVSQMWPTFYCRTCEPYALAMAATLSEFKPAFRNAALEATHIDGEADYGISATIYNPEDVDPSEAPDPVYLNHYVCPECNHSWIEETEDSDLDMTCDECGQKNIEPEDSEEQERDGDDSYCAANGAWFICEVFPVNDPTEWNDRSTAPRYDSLDNCFTAGSKLLAMAREE